MTAGFYIIYIRTVLAGMFSALNEQHFFLYTRPHTKSKTQKSIILLVKVCKVFFNPFNRLFFKWHPSHNKDHHHKSQLRASQLLNERRRRRIFRLFWGRFSVSRYIKVQTNYVSVLQDKYRTEKNTHTLYTGTHKHHHTHAYTSTDRHIITHTHNTRVLLSFLPLGARKQS